ncbi:MAG: carbohydrate kinase family protein [Patescibacteria group bacterium]|jgi:ribokinase|nr:carbohydrate kinase family protein [Patescibacteria group bacterium]
MYDIISIGSATRDGFFEGIPFVVVKDKRFRVGKGIALPYGGKVKVPKITFTTGGGGTNTAVTFARQGLKTACIFRVGKDVSGEEIIRNLQREKVDTLYVQIDKNTPTAYSVIFLTETGERTILSYKGAGENISEKEIPWNKLKTRWLYLNSLGGNLNLLKKSLWFAQKNNIFVAANPGGGELENLKKHKELLKYFDIFIVNQEEASYLTDIPYQKENLVFQKLDELIQGLVVMTKGPDGVSVSNGKTLWQAGTYPEKRIVDRTGAGDAFASGFVSVFAKEKIKKAGFRSIFQDEKIKEAIKVGSANGTSVVEYVGAKTGILYKKDLGNKRWKKLPLKIFSLTNN